MDEGLVLLAMTRIMPRVVRDENDCWVWSGAKSSAGYGNIRVNKVWRHTHQFSFEFHKGPVPVGMEIDHLCRNRACCNPSHLEAVTRAENLRRARLHRVPSTHCARGHEMTEENTMREGPNGARRCRICRLAQKNRNARDRRAAAL